MLALMMHNVALAEPSNKPSMKHEQPVKHQHKKTDEEAKTFILGLGNNKEISNLEPSQFEVAFYGKNKNRPAAIVAKIFPNNRMLEEVTKVHKEAGGKAKESCWLCHFMEKWFPQKKIKTN